MSDCSKYCQFIMIVHIYDMRITATRGKKTRTRNKTLKGKKGTEGDDKRNQGDQDKPEGTIETFMEDRWTFADRRRRLTPSGGHTRPK